MELRIFITSALFKFMHQLTLLAEPHSLVWHEYNVRPTDFDYLREHSSAVEAFEPKKEEIYFCNHKDQVERKIVAK